MAETLTLDRRHTALLVMDYQNNIVSRIAGDSAGLLDRASATLAAARSAHIPVIYVAVRFREGYLRSARAIARLAAYVPVAA